MSDNNEDHTHCPHPDTKEWKEACNYSRRPTTNPEVYDGLAIKMIDVLYNHFPEGAKIDFVKVAEAMAYAYYCTISSQIEHNPMFEHKLNPHMINNMVMATSNGIGEILASEGIAMPRVGPRRNWRFKFQ